MLSQRILHALFTYDSKTGHLSWTNPLKGYKNYKGRIGHKAEGYLKAGIFGELYQVSKLVWQYHNGYYPEKILDHLNGITDDNRIENLREVSIAENCRNRSLSKKNSSGVRGVRRDGNWVASISYNNKFYYLGCSEDFIEAVYLRYTAEKCFDWDSFKHQSTAYQYIKAYEKSLNHQDL